MDNIVTTLSGGIDLLYSEEEEFLERVGENIDFDIFDLPRDIKKVSSLVNFNWSFSFSPIFKCVSIPCSPVLL